jgi:FSR family fosmidomycin resistance protein-like MFS transporter
LRRASQSDAAKSGSYPVRPIPAAVAALLTLALLHALVDTFALFVQPLWPDLQRSFGRRVDDVQWAYVSWSLATSFSQLLFGYLGDRYSSKWLLWLGPALGMLCVSSIGLVDHFLLLNGILFLGGLGIAAFHPEAAAAAGACLPENRSRAMSLFAVGGYLGQAAGPLYSGVVTTKYGLAGLSWSLVWGAAALALLMLGLRRAPAAETHPSREHVRVGSLLNARGAVLCLLLAICTLRVLPMLGVPLALAFAIKLDGGSNAHIGLVQSAFLVGIGVGSLACAWLVRPTNERRAMWLLPLFAVPVLAACPVLHDGWLLVAVSVSGLILGGAMPVLIGYGQQLLPEAQRVASSITMGVTWGLSGLIVAGVMAYVNRLGEPRAAIHLFAGATAVSALLSVYLPEAAPGRASSPELSTEY